MSTREEAVTGKMDRCISEVILITKETVAGTYGDDVTKQTLKHHAEDMILAGQTVLKMFGRTDEQVVQVLNNGNSE